MSTNFIVGGSLPDNASKSDFYKLVTDATPKPALIEALDPKATPTSADKVMIFDAAAGALKYSYVHRLPTDPAMNYQVSNLTVNQNLTVGYTIRAVGTITSESNLSAVDIAASGDITATDDITAGGDIAATGLIVSTSGVSAPAVQASGATPVLQIVDTDGAVGTHHYFQMTLACGATPATDQWLYFQSPPRGSGAATTNPMVINIRAESNSFVLNADSSVAMSGALGVTGLSSLNGGVKLPVTGTTPTTGTAGEIRIMAGYIYVCVATDTWKKVAIA